ncbi:MAG TPA: response regulator [Sphingobacteriaceae bacterium]
MNVVTLIVDDDTLTQLIHRKALERAGIASSPETFADGEKALNFLLDHYSEENNYLVFLDLNMPVMDGWTFLDEMGRNFQGTNIHVVIVTSSVSAEDRARANGYNQVLKYLVKPISLDSLKLMNQFVTLNQEHPLE